MIWSLKHQIKVNLISDRLKAFIIVLIIPFCIFGLVGEIRANLNDLMMMELMSF